jgi:N-acetylmuramoyl-L-alanine amidase
VVLDIESISDYKIFSLKDPFRVIVDVRGEKKEGTATADRAQTPAAKAPPEKNAPPTIGPEQVPASRTQTKAEVFITLQDQKKVKPSQSTSSRHKADGGAISLAQQLGLGIRRIVIDPGHGGKDPGAMAFNLKEKDIVLNVALRTSAILKKKYHYDVVLTRDTDTFIPLEERTAIANTNNADLFVSVHVNAHPKKTAKGVETFYLNLATNTEAMRVAARENATSTHNISEMQGILSDLMQNSKIRESSQLAESVQSSLIRGLKKKRYTLKNLGVKQAPFYVLIGAEMPAVLAEISFITNPEEARLLQKDSYLQTIAEQIAAGVAAYGAQRRTAALQL